METLIELSLWGGPEMATDRLRVGLIGANVNYGWAPRAPICPR